MRSSHLGVQVRERGIDGVGVAEIAKAAELTHGALYAHFPSKDALVAEAFSHGFEKNLKATARPKAECSFQDHLTALFAASARDDLAGGCPMAASASEIGRQDGEVSARFASAFEQMVTTLEASLGDEEGATPNRQLAVATVAAQIGALVVRAPSQRRIKPCRTKYWSQRAKSFQRRRRPCRARTRAANAGQDRHRTSGAAFRMSARARSSR